MHRLVLSSLLWNCRIEAEEYRLPQYYILEQLKIYRLV